MTFVSVQHSLACNFALIADSKIVTRSFKLNFMKRAKTKFDTSQNVLVKSLSTVRQA